jgi:photosystem II stability/assembly factor-like uncharacterized protein
MKTMRTMFGLVAVGCMTPTLWGASVRADTPDANDTVPMLDGIWLSSAWSSGGNDISVVGDGGTVLTSPDGGQTWSDNQCSEADLTAIWGASPTSLWAVGEGGEIVHSSDGFESDCDELTSARVDTKVSKAPAADAGAHDLLGLWGSSATDIYAVGEQGVILHSTDGKAFTPLSSGQTVSLLAVWGSAANDVYAVGDNGTILHSADGGKTWQAQKSGTTETLASVWGASATDVFAAGEGGVILHSADHGKTWQAETSGTTQNLFEIWGRQAGETFAVGDGGVIARSTDGKTWTLEGSGTDHDLASIRATSQGFVAVGEAGAIASSPDGLAWTLETTGQRDTLVDIAADKKGDLVAFGGDGTIIESKDGGTTLTEAVRGAVDPEPFCNGAWLADDGTYWAVGNWGSMERSTDGGVHWTQVDLPVDHEDALFRVWSTGKVVVAVGEHGLVVVSKDGGKTFTETQAATDVPLYGVWGDGKNLFAVGGRGIILTSSDGTTFTKVASGTTFDLLSVWGDDKGHIVAVGGLTSPEGMGEMGSTTDMGEIVHSLDGGKTWDHVPGAGFRVLNGVWGGGGAFYAVGDGGTALASSDAGVTFQPLPSGTQADLAAVASSGSGPVLAVGADLAIAHLEPAPTIKKPAPSSAPSALPQTTKATPTTPTTK